MTLYRKWRPQSFKEIIGQEPIVRTLQNAIGQQRVAHAYLFTGPRGTGKTSLARILAKALNCEKGEVIEPCLACAPCTRIRDGYFADVLEMDAASNRGIDEIRELRERVRFVPVEGRKKIYIIDEVHMLTTEAFNALLKMLEEPPEHVIFILATTEPHKVPATIVSRCQRFDFLRVSGQGIYAHLLRIAKEENFSVTESALWRIVAAAEGGVRDALSLLDQLHNFSGEKITEEDVDRLLGSVPTEQFLNLLEALINGKQDAIFQLTDAFVEQGVHMMQVLRDFLHFGRAVLVHLAGAKEDIWLEDAARKRLTTLCDGLTIKKWREAMDHLSQVEAQVRWHSAPRILFEVALLEVQEKLGSGVAPVMTAASPPVVLHKTAVEPVADLWSAVLEKLRERDLPAALALEEGEWDQNRVYFTKGSSYFIYLLNLSKHKMVVEDTIAEVFGAHHPVVYEIRSLLASQKKASLPPEKPRPQPVAVGQHSSGITIEDIKEIFG